MTLSAQSLWHKAEQGGTRPFLITPSHTYSYANLCEGIVRWIGLFDRAGLERGDRVLIRTQDEFVMISAFLATVLDGKVAVALSADTPGIRRNAIANFTEARCLIDDSLGDTPLAGLQSFLVGSEDNQSAPKGLIAKLTGKAKGFLHGLPALFGERSPICNAGADHLAYLLFTSGTTGEPAGVQITHGNLMANLATLSRLFYYGPYSRIFNDMALAHADGMIQGPCLALANQCAVIRANGFSLPGLEDWLSEIRRQRATHAIMVPTIWSMIDLYAQHDDYFDAPEMQSLQSVAAKLDVDLWHRLQKRFRLPLANHYGLTETVASALYAGPQNEMGPIGSLGRPVDCEARIEPQTDGSGELQLSGDNIFSGYWRNEARTNSSFTDDGWLRTGDLATRNEDGSFAILGRLKNIIMSGGFLIRPEEIDEVLTRHPAVQESVTVAIEDEMFGEIPSTAVVLKKTHRDVSTQALIDHARGHLEARKVPKHVITLETIPKGISGKARLDAVKEMLRTSLNGREDGTKPNTCGNDIQTDILALAAKTFRCRSEDLTIDTGPGDIAGWDSFSHLNLILGAERQFGVRLPAAKIAGITTLADLAAAVQELR
ncbi:MAG: AMP-binding protein [Pseudomonadota bacterium]